MAHIPAEHRRQEFIRATIGVIAEHGVPGTTTREIAAAAGAPLASLHYCFSSKEELLAAVFEEQARFVIDAVTPVPPRAGLAVAAEQIIRDSAAWTLRHRDFILAQEELSFWARRQTPVDAARRTYDRYHARVTEILEGACGRGDEPSLAAPTASMISMLMDGLLLQWFAFRDDDRFLGDVDRAVAVCAASLRQQRAVATKPTTKGASTKGASTKGASTKRPAASPRRAAAR